MHSICVRDAAWYRKRHKLKMSDISVTRDLGQWFVDLPHPIEYQGHYSACCKWDAICQCIKAYESHQEQLEEDALLEQDLVLPTVLCPGFHLAKAINYCGKRFLLVCDNRCDKAWGHNQREKVMLGKEGDDEYDDNYEYLADDELGTAPIHPGSSEGGQIKPQDDENKLNKWCCRECERSQMIPMDSPLYDFSKRVKNIDED